MLEREHTMKRSGCLVPFVIFLLSTIGPATSKDVANDPNASLIAAGHQIVLGKCARCHAVSREGTSAHPEAPAFRDVANRYSVWTLAEALAEGIVTGHADMPEFRFEPNEISEILSYMDSLKGRVESAP